MTTLYTISIHGNIVSIKDYANKALALRAARRIAGKNPHAFQITEKGAGKILEVIANK